MKRILIIKVCLILLLSFSDYAQPYLYFHVEFVDTTYSTIDTLDKIQRYNFINGTIDNIPNIYQYVGSETYITSDPSQTILLISSIDYNKLIYFFYDAQDTSNYFFFPPDYGGIDEFLYYPQGNKLFLFTNDYSSINVMDLSTRQIVDTLNFNNVIFSNQLIYPYRNSFFSKDSSKIYFFSRDAATQPYQVSTYSIAANEIIQKRDLSELGYPNTDGYYLTFGRNGKGIICSFPNYNNPIKDFYFRVYDLEADTGSTFIPINQPSEACFSGNGEFLIIMNMDITSSRVVYYTGSGGIYKIGTGELIKSINFPSGGSIYNYDNYPNNIYYVIDLEEPTRQIYTLKMDSIFNVIDLTSLEPSSVIVNSSPFTLTVNGHGFDSLSAVYFNDTAKTTTYISDSVLTAEISTSDISVVGNYPVWVTDEWGTSDTLTFEVTPVPPVLTSISPEAVFIYMNADLSDFSVTAYGGQFNDSSVVYFNGNAKTTTFVSDSELTFQIHIVSDIPSNGNYPVWVSNYGSNSDTLIFSRVSSLAQTVVPILECVQDNGGGSFTAFYGYNNNNNNSVYIPFGYNNYFQSLLTPDRGQPRVYLPGSHSNVFSVNFDGNNLTWTLVGTSVTANKKSTPCP